MDCQCELMKQRWLSRFWGFFRCGTRSWCGTRDWNGFTGRRYLLLNHFIIFPSSSYSSSTGFLITPRCGLPHHASGKSLCWSWPTHSPWCCQPCPCKHTSASQPLLKILKIFKNSHPHTKTLESNHHPRGTYCSYRGNLLRSVPRHFWKAFL